MQGWGLLVWVAAYRSLKETAGDTVNWRMVAAWGVGRPVTPHQDCPSGQRSGNIPSSKPLCLTFSREEAGGSHGPMCGELSVCARVAGGSTLCHKETFRVLGWGWGTLQGGTEGTWGGRWAWCAGLSTLQLRRGACLSLRVRPSYGGGIWGCAGA